MSATTNLDGLFIAPDGNDHPCIWFEATPGDDFPELVMAEPPHASPQRHLWNLVVHFLPKRKDQS